jgi:hypothetical protein
VLALIEIAIEGVLFAAPSGRQDQRNENRRAERHNHHQNQGLRGRLAAPRRGGGDWRRGRRRQFEDDRLTTPQGRYSATNPQGHESEAACAGK